MPVEFPPPYVGGYGRGSGREAGLECSCHSLSGTKHRNESLRPISLTYSHTYFKSEVLQCRHLK